MKWLWIFPKEKKKPWCSYLAAKYLSNGKNGLTNPPLKYPASRKVLFDTERLSGRTWARLWLGNGKLIRFWDDAVPLSSEMHAIIYINSQGSHDLKVIDYIQYEGEKRISLPIQLPIQEHLASEYLFFFFCFFYGLHKSYLPAQRRIISFGSSILTVIIMPILPKKIFR
ncbi:hypothetical protein LguiA_035870 [Lonicera macranthoides]